MEPDEIGSGRKVRVCDDCLGQDSDGEARVMLRHHLAAGYPDFTLAKAKQAVAARHRTPAAQRRYLRDKARRSGARSKAGL
jgi:hypothetical protein